MKIAISIVRIIVGVLFIFSGLVKANDPLGLSYKMQEFFEVWGLSFLDNYTLAFALILNSFEIIAGVAVLLGWRMKFFSWLLLVLIIFFTFLTGYALFSGKIKTCGCFGDCIPLTAKQSFMKDVFLLLLIIVIFLKRDVIKPVYDNAGAIVVIAFTVVCCIVSQWYVLNHLPVVDCLAYKKGNNILEKMKTPEGAVPDSFAIKFKYRKNGKDVVFDSDHFPDDFNDSTYKFVDRVQELIRPGTATAPISDFILYSESGADTTLPILQQPGYYVMLFTKDANQAKADWNKNAAMVANACYQKQLPFFVVTATTDAAKQQLSNVQNVNYLKCDATVIKTAARVNPTYFVMKGATIVAKYADDNYGKVIRRLDKSK
jgi:uncharacterized membrane protein YphA (DoxX/SURF4 family)